MWSAVTEPEHISHWFGAAPPSTAPGAGAPGTLTLPDHGADPDAGRGDRRAPHGLLPLGQRRRQRRDRRPRSTTRTRRSSPSPSRPLADGTQLTVVETGFETTSDPTANLEDHRGGWDGELDKLVALLEGDVVTTGTLVPVFAALGDETRWSILAALGEGDASASALAGRLPVSRQAIAKHLAVLQEVGLVEPVRVGREVQYRVLGSQLSATAQPARRHRRRMGPPPRRDQADRRGAVTPA